MVKNHETKKTYYSKQMITYHQCTGCKTLLKGQRGISLHRKYCLMNTNPVTKIIETKVDITKLIQMNGGTVIQFPVPENGTDYFHDDSLSETELNSNFSHHETTHGNIDQFEVEDSDESVNNNSFLITLDMEEKHCNKLIDQRKRHLETGKESVEIDARYGTHIELLRLLKRRGVPLCLYDEIMNWAHKSSKYKNFDFTKKPNLRKTVIESLFTRYDLNGLKPQRKTLKLPSTDKEVEVIIHDIHQCIYSILCDPDLNQDEKYYFKDYDSPLIPMERDNNTIYDFFNAKAFKDAEKMYRNNPDNEIIVPICLFIDKTHATENGRFTCEPVSMCLMLYDVETRNLPQSWRTIGYVLNQSDSENKQETAHLKLVDYHECLNTILQQLKEFQEKDGFKWRIPFKGKVYEVIMKTPILFIAGDNEGLDKIAGRYGSRSHNVKCICRYCNTPLKETGNPDFAFKYLTNQQMVKYIQNGNIDALDSLSHHYINNNIFRELVFCHEKRGFCSALPFDILHTIQLGWMMYIVEGVLSTPILSRDERHREEKELRHSGAEKNYYKSKNDDNKRNKWNVFSERRKKQFDCVCKIYGYRLTRQSDRNLPRTYFPNGVCGDQKRKGHEMSGVVLLFLIVFLSSDGDHYERKMGSYLFANYIHLFEMILMMEQFIRQRAFNTRDVKLFKDHAPAIMNLYKDTVNRKKGMGDNLIKIHLLMHMADDILNLGLPISFDSAPGENRHISAVKIPASKTQHNSDTFYEQIGKRVVEDIAIDRGFNDINETIEHLEKLHLNEKKGNELRSQIYRVNNTHILRKTINNKFNYQPWPDQKFYNKILNFFQLYILPHTTENEVKLYTEYAVYDEEQPTEIYRAHPDFNKQSWNDWVYVNWKDYGEIPAKILIFFEINNWKEGCIVECNGTYISSPGKYAVCHMIKESLEETLDDTLNENSRAHPSSLLVKYAKLMLEGNVENNENKIPLLGIINIDSFSRPCIAVPYDLKNEMDDYGYLFIESRHLWSEIFVKFLSDEIKIHE